MREEFIGCEESGLPGGPPVPPALRGLGLALVGLFAVALVRSLAAASRPGVVEEPAAVASDTPKPGKRRAKPKRVNPPMSSLVDPGAGAGVARRTAGPAYVELRPYQREAVGAVFDAWHEGRQRLWITLASGLGKTVVFSEVTRRLRREGKARPVLVVAHREELLDQAAEKLRAACPSARVGIERANRQSDPGAEIILASVQTLGRDGCKRAEWLERRGPSLIIIDECQHATAGSYWHLLARYGAFDQRRTRVLGCTATPDRLDGAALEEVFEAEVFSYGLAQGIADRWLVPIRAWRVEGGCDLSRVRTRRGDWSAKELSQAVNVPERTRRACEAFLRRGEDRRTLAFCCDVRHSRDVAALFRSMGVRAAAVDGAMSRQERVEVIRAFRDGRLPVLVNCEVATEGFDVPEVACVLMLRPTQSPSLYEQMVGRGTRRSHCKDHLRVIDLVDRPAREQVTVPELFGLPTSFDPEGQSVNYCAGRWQTLLARGWRGEPRNHRELESALAELGEPYRTGWQGA